MSSIGSSSSPPSPVSQEPPSGLQHQADRTKESATGASGSSLDVIENDTDADVIDLTNIRMREIPDLSLCHRLHTLTLRSNFITAVDGLHLLPALTDLDLYENRIIDLNQCSFPPTLTSLDLSFNQIRVITNLDNLPKLTSLYLANNKISVIENLMSLPSLSLLELGSNRIRVIPPPETQLPRRLAQLWLGRNKISSVPPLSALPLLTHLSVQSNRLTSILPDSLFPSAAEGGGSSPPALLQLYLSHNGLSAVAGIAACTLLTTLDLTANQLSSLSGLEPLQSLQDCWLGGNELQDWEEVERVLADKPRLSCLYLEGNALAQDAAAYRSRVKQMLPQLTQLDADELQSVVTNSTAGAATAVCYTSNE